MFSIQQKRDISDAVQEILQATKHSELPDGEINFLLHVDGAEGWSWADIRNNGAIVDFLQPSAIDVQVCLMSFMRYSFVYS